MLKDIVFALLLISGAAYAHSYKSTILDFMQGKEQPAPKKVLSKEVQPLLAGKI